MGEVRRPDLGEERLVALIATGDRSSFSDLFMLYAPKVKAYMRKMGATDAAAEDLAQEALLRVWRNAGQFDAARGNVAAWIFTIARNAYIDAARKERHPSDLQEQPQRPAAHTPEEALLARDRIQRTQRALSELSTSQGRVCEAVLLGGSSLRHAAERLGLSLPTAKSHLRRGLAKLKASVNEA